MPPEKRKYSKIVKIANRDKIENYVWCILIRLQPHIYKNKENRCIVIQVQDNLLEFADRIISFFKCVGVEEVSRKRASYNVEGEGGTYRLDEAWEIVLKKTKAIEKIKEDEIAWHMWKP